MGQRTITIPMNKKQDYKYNKYIFYPFICQLPKASFSTYYQIEVLIFCDNAFQTKHIIFNIKNNISSLKTGLLSIGIKKGVTENFDLKKIK